MVDVVDTILVAGVLVAVALLVAAAAVLGGLAAGLATAGALIGGLSLGLLVVRARQRPNVVHSRGGRVVP